jgi:hypothetical protein
MASINSGVSVNVAFHAIISKLTAFPVVTFQLAFVIQFESGFLIVSSTLELSSHVVADSHRLVLNSSNCFKYSSLFHFKASKRAKYKSYCTSSITISLNLKINKEASHLDTGLSNFAKFVSFVIHKVSAFT